MSHPIRNDAVIWKAGLIISRTRPRWISRPRLPPVFVDRLSPAQTIGAPEPPTPDISLRSGDVDDVDGTLRSTARAGHSIRWPSCNTQVQRVRILKHLRFSVSRRPRVLCVTITTDGEVGERTLTTRYTDDAEFVQVRDHLRVHCGRHLTKLCARRGGGPASRRPELRDLI